MPRETVAQRNARLAAEREYEEKMQAATYPQRLMAALEEATQKNNYELTVENGLFLLRDRDTGRWDNSLHLPVAYSADAQMGLESLQWDLRQKASDREEAARQAAMKEAALAKLTKEERELLGL